ncbi:conserved unknown protein [Ectocarpus siliculosus]|uniref:Transmembrane protein n=1 Tax=Ectocarpus siliculosus TaxID=2880 RepID=D7G913_ECTSI|nr:conserved unknown protein [Ectocarpus siliculosus]|eukprot:CBJ28174.1 conserved unknown protein [Ectocarpus siliculosus]
MEANNSKEDDIEVDHYFLPGGILDTHHEEDMIGGSLLDEIGGVGNVTALHPAKQMASRIVGSGPRTDLPPAATASDRRPQQFHRKITSVIGGGPTRLSVEGTNPMAKEFTPSTCSIPADAAVELPTGSLHAHSRHPAPETVNRVFSAAVGSEVKTAAAELPYRTAMQRQSRNLQGPPGPPGPITPPQPAAQRSLGDRAQQHPRHQPGGKPWPVRATVTHSHPGPTLPSKHRLTIAKGGSSTGRDHVHDDTVGRGQRVDQVQAVSRGPSRNRIQAQPGVRRVSHGQANSPHQDASTKVSSRRQEDFVDHTAQPSVGSRLESARDDSSQQPMSTSLFPVEQGQEMLPPQASNGLSSSAQRQGSHAERTARDDGEPSLPATSSSGTPQQSSSSGRMSSSNERSSRQARPEDESACHLQSHVHKEKDKGKFKKKDDRTYRAAPNKQVLGTAVKEPSRMKLGTRPSLSQKIRLMGGYLRSSSLGIVAAIVRTIAWQLNRLRLVRRMLTLVSFAASSSVSLLSAVILSTSWLFLLGLRLHSLALKEITGSIHVAVCFLFPYCFQYLVSAIDEWAPHWLPACLWYSFLMQMFCTSNHQYKHSMSSHLVPALRALLPVAFLCEVPSGRSYLLALGGSELLLLSFTLAAVRLRCIFSPIFLLSWSCQVFALATCGSSASLQYGQVLVSLASLHAVSMVDVMLNSRFYHARYRAGMSLTNGFRTVP